MSVRDQHQINIGQVIKGQARSFESLDDNQPIGPIRVDQDIESLRLQQERGMPNPRDSHLPVQELGKKRLQMRAMALGEERGDEHLRQKIALVPPLLGPQTHTARFRRSAPSLGGRRGAGFSGNFFPVFHRREILARMDAGAMNDSRAAGFPGGRWRGQPDSTKGGNEARYAHALQCPP